MRAFSLIAAAAGVLAGCGAAPLDYHSPNEIPPGPGLLSGEQGVFVVRLGERPRFPAWKPTEEDAAEYQEFLDWREWRQWRQRQGR